MEYRHAPLTDRLCDEIDALIKDYYGSTKASEGIPPYDFNWSLFTTLADQGMVHVWTARDEGMLAGVAIYFVTYLAHHQEHIVAECDTLSVSPRFRGQGIGRKLMEEAEPTLRALGVNFIRHHHRMVYDAEPLFDKVPGYKATEVLYVKEL